MSIRKKFELAITVDHDTHKAPSLDDLSDAIGQIETDTTESSSARITGVQYDPKTFELIVSVQLDEA